eukprot:1045470_1
MIVFIRPRSLLAFILLAFIASSQCGYYLVENRPYVMDSCHTNIPPQNIHAVSSSIYSCFTDSNKLLHQLWSNSNCNGSPDTRQLMECNTPKCFCMNIPECDIWSYHKYIRRSNHSNCSSADAFETASLMVNQCFNSQYKYICRQGTLLSMQYDEDECTGDSHVIDITEPQQNTDEMCIEYYCDMQKLNQSMPLTTHDGINIIKHATDHDTGGAWESVFLVLIASVSVIVIIVYCYKLKPPHQADSPERGKYSQVKQGTVETMQYVPDQNGA